VFGKYFDEFLPARLLSADRITFEHRFAIPIRSEARRLPEQRKPNDYEGEEAYRDQSK
jgi:hypothetical protein